TAQLRQHHRFLVAKTRLSFRGENGADRLSITLFQFVIRIEPHPAQSFRQQPRHRTLAAAARTNQEEEGFVHRVSVSSSSRIAIGDRARLTALRINSMGASRW